VKREPLLLDPSEVSDTIGVQGLSWYAERLRQDADGDVAMEFMELERPPEANKAGAKAEVQVRGRVGGLHGGLSILYLVYSTLVLERGN
jgi:hypothetical protein